jgi:hypothetical protein
LHLVDSLIIYRINFRTRYYESGFFALDQTAGSTSSLMDKTIKFIGDFGGFNYIISEIADQ